MKLDFFLGLIKYFELGAAFIGFLNYKKLKGSIWIYLPCFLFILFILECVGLWLTNDINANLNLYKFVVIPLIFIVYSLLFKKILKLKFSKVINFGFSVFLISLIAETTFLSNHYFYSFSLSVANIFFLIYVLKYYTELIQSEKIITFHKSIDFWFCSGILIFYLGCLPYFSLYNLLATKYYETIFLPYTWVFVLLNYIMYILFSVGFIWNKKK